MAVTQRSRHCLDCDGSQRERRRETGKEGGREGEREREREREKWMQIQGSSEKTVG
jgi:hypothetical protein